MWESIAGASIAVLLGAVGGGLLSGIAVLFTWIIDRRAHTAEQLLSEGLAIHASLEGWAVEGPNFRNCRLSEHHNLPQEESDGNWLRKVEVRFVLDESEWNLSANDSNEYGILDGRRAWIIRDIGLPPSYPGAARRGEWHPALLSSRALHELAGWIERVADVDSLQRFGFRLGISKQGLNMLWPLLKPVATKDRRQVLESRLTPQALDFLAWYEKNYSDRPSLGRRNH